MSANESAAKVLVSLFLADIFMAIGIAIVCFVAFAVNALAVFDYWGRWALPSDDELYADQVTLIGNVDYRPALGGFGALMAMPQAKSALLNSAKTNGKPMRLAAREK